MEKYSFGKRLKEYRKSKGLSQGEFGELIGKSASAVYGYETNQIMPSCDTLSRMTAVLSVEIEDLLDLEQELTKGSNEMYQLFVAKWQEQKNEKTRYF